MGELCVNGKDKTINKFNIKQIMNSTHEYFEEVEIEHDCTTYFANGYADYTVSCEIGGDYEGYEYEQVFTRELYDITITELWFVDEETENAVEILNQYDYLHIEKIAEEYLRYMFE